MTTFKTTALIVATASVLLAGPAFAQAVSDAQQGVPGSAATDRSKAKTYDSMVGRSAATPSSTTPADTIPSHQTKTGGPSGGVAGRS